MKLHILFGQRKESYEGEHAPEALLCWDEYSVEGNPEGFDKEVEETKKACEPDSFMAMRVIEIEVSQDRIRKLLVDTPVVHGDIKTEE